MGTGAPCRRCGHRRQGASIAAPAGRPLPRLRGRCECRRTVRVPPRRRARRLSRPRFGWGYDGVDLWAPSHLYGTPDDFRAFVDAAHAIGLGVILDVVYNHFGPDGNYVSRFSPSYFTKKYVNEWGEAINYDGDDAGGVREFVAENAAYWIEEFHLDGLRLDATQSIHDFSPEHILGVITRKARAAAGERAIVLVA